MSRIATPPPVQRQPRVRNKPYLAFIAQLPCTVCAREPVEVAHVRYASACFAKDEPGMQAKPDDLWTLPLCPAHHRYGKKAQHASNERTWWRCWFKMQEPLSLCLLLRYRCFPDEQKARKVLNEWRVA